MKKSRILVAITENIRYSMDPWFLQAMVNYLSEDFYVDLVMDYDISKPEEIDAIKHFKSKTSADRLFALSARRENLDFTMREELTHKFKSAIEDLKLPDSNYYYWRSLAYDEYYGSMENLRYRAEEVIRNSNPDALLVPIVSVISSTGRTEVMISPLVYHAKKQGIPIVGYKNAGFIDRNFIHLYETYDAFFVHTLFDMEFLFRIGIEKERVFILRQPYAWLTSFTLNSNARLYWDGIKDFKKSYNIPDDAFLITSFHIFSHRRDAREIAKTLLKLSENIYILMVTDKNDYRKTINNHDTALNYTFYDLRRDYGDRLIIEEINFTQAVIYADAIVLPSDLMYNDIFLFNKPVVIYNVSLPFSYRYGNVLYTSDSELLSEYIEDYIKNTETMKKALTRIIKTKKVKR